MNLNLKELLPLTQIVVASLVMVFILLQQRGQALGSAFGQESGFYATKRGLQKKLFWGTVVFGSIFILLAILNLVI